MEGKAKLPTQCRNSGLKTYMGTKNGYFYGTLQLLEVEDGQNQVNMKTIPGTGEACKFSSTAERLSPNVGSPCVVGVWKASIENRNSK